MATPLPAVPPPAAPPPAAPPLAFALSTTVHVAAAARNTTSPAALAAAVCASLTAALPAAEFGVTTMLGDDHATH